MAEQVNVVSSTSEDVKPLMQYVSPLTGHGCSYIGTDHIHPVGDVDVNYDSHTDVLSMHRRRLPVFEIMAKHPLLHGFVKATLQFRWKYAPTVRSVHVVFTHDANVVRSSLRRALVSTEKSFYVQAGMKNRPAHYNYAGKK